MKRWVEREGELLERASSACGHDDFGGDEFLGGLHALLFSLDENKLLNRTGHIAIAHMIVRDLRARLIAEHGFKTHPESADHEIRSPVVIVGLPRTGTTALQELLALDPQLQGLELWLTRAPKPRPNSLDYRADDDYRACELEVESIRRYQPALHAIHKMEAGKVDECWYLMSQSFAHSSWVAQTQLPEFLSWFEMTDMVPVYERHRRNLQLIGSTEPDKRWLLKDSTHLFGLDAFLDVYPDAKVIQTHRDPVESIPSVCGLCWTARKTLNRKESAAEFGELTLDLWHMGVERVLGVREERGDDSFLDVSFARFKAEPMAVIEEIYSHADLELSDETRTAMQAFRDANPPEKAPPHRYALGDWDLDADDIRERFTTYRERHGFS